MGLGDIAEAMKLGNRVVSILEKLTTDARIREQFALDGKIEGKFSLLDYEVKFVVEDRKRVSIPAEIEEVK
jgi:hypothetical protein